MVTADSMRTPAEFTADQAAAFRLRRHHLVPDARAGRSGGRASLADVCRDTAGIQAQVMSAAEIAIWTRRRGTTREDVQRGLWTERDLVKTAAMRLTLHVLPASDFAMYITALKPSAAATLQNIFTRIGAKRSELDHVVDTMLDALRDGPQTQQALLRRAAEGASRSMRIWLEHAWSAVRPAVVEGLICYGPPKGSAVTFVRTDRWLPPQPHIGLADARAELMRRFLAAFGPATVGDFSKWSGIRAGDAQRVLESLEDEVIRVSVDGAPGWLRRRDVRGLAASRLDRAAVRLLPGFDALLLAHATKDHLVDPKHYSRVYRPQGWISPVVLAGGRIVAVWFSKPRGASVEIDVQPFERLARSVRAGIDADVDALSRFLGLRCEVRVGTV